MVAVDEDALTCDFASEYGIYEWRDLPLNKAAVLAIGLPEDSRIKMKMSGMKTDTKTLLLGAISDGITLLMYAMTGAKEQPESLVLPVLLGKEKEETKSGFASVDEYEEARKKILGG